MTLAADNCLCLIMAAGSSERFGQRDKRFVPLKSGQSILRTTVECIAQAKLNYKIAVRREDLNLPELTPFKDKLIPIENAKRGFGYSLSQAIQSLNNTQEYGQIEYVMICLADMPYIDSSTYQLLARSANPKASAWMLSNNPSNESDKKDQILNAGNPVMIDKTWFCRFIKLNGDKGGRALLLEEPNQINIIRCDDPGIYQDIDRQNDIL